MVALAPERHAQDMDGIYRIQRHFYDLTRKYYLLGRDRLLANLDAQPGMCVLEVGCGTGRNLIKAARRWPAAHFTGLDISEAMLRTALGSIRRSGLSDSMALVQGDACTFARASQLRDMRFDRIFFSYTLSMIPGWEQALDEALHALAPEGTLHIVDFGQQEKLPRWFRGLLFAWLRHFHVTPRAALPEALARIANRHGRMVTFRPLYRGYAWEAVVSPR